MNKKGYYGAILVIGVIVAVVMVYIKLTGSYAGLNRLIGDAQAPVLETNPETRFLEAYVKEAAKLAIENAIDDIAYYPQLQGLPPPKTLASTYCTYLNTPQTSTRLSYKPHFYEGLQKAFNEHMNGHLEKYEKYTDWTIPKDNFVVNAEKGALIGVSKKPATKPIQDFAGRTIGNIAYRPTFRIDYNHRLEEYPQIFETLARIARECYVSDPSNCAVLKNIPSDWEIQNDGDLYRFDVPRGTRKSCYILHLPKSTQPST